MKIRKATLKDVNPILGIWEEVTKCHAQFDDCFWNNNDLVKNWKEKWRTYERRYIKNKKNITLVAEEEGKLLGFMGFQFKKRPLIFKQNKYIHISSVGVAEIYRGRGIGTKLMNEVLKIAKKRGAFAANLHVRTLNTRAKKFYSKFGFKDTMVEVVKKL